jgi:hypothetical protein
MNIGGLLFCLLLPTGASNKAIKKFSQASFHNTNCTGCVPSAVFILIFIPTNHLANGLE